MSLTTNATFDRLLAELNRMGDETRESPTQSSTYQTFIRRYPTSALRDLSLEAYCVGKGDGNSFCWWLERGLEPVLGRYIPGTAKGHMLYFSKDESVYKNRHLKELSDTEALRYTMCIQATVAEADPTQDISWIDDDSQIYQRAGVKPRVTVGDGRKLRLLSAYHPDETLPISSSDHVRHFLLALGCPPQNIPSQRAPVARMLLLRRYFELARESCQGLTTQGFVKALYADSLGIAPVKDVDMVLGHFAAVPELATSLEGASQTDVFCQFALVLNEAKLDWWVTDTKAICAGRCDDPTRQQAVTVLELDLSAQGVRVRLVDEDTDWELLDADIAARATDAAQGSQRLQALTHRKACWPDDYDSSETTLTVSLTRRAIRNGHIKVPKVQSLFPAACIAANKKSGADTFTLHQPDGTSIKTTVLADRNRIHAQFKVLFKNAELKHGDQAIITKEGDRVYRLAVNRQRNMDSDDFFMFDSLNETTATPLKSENMVIKPLNQILYGPPGTGKTYATIARAVELLSPEFYEKHKDERVPENRKALKGEFDRLSSPKEGRVRFVTFHQSFSYEDFVEGIRAVTDEAEADAAESPVGLTYRVERGVFKQICEDAMRDKASEEQFSIRPDAVVWKLSIEEAASDGTTRNYCLNEGEGRIGWSNTGDLLTQDFERMPELGIKEKSSLRHFAFTAQPGDVVVCLKTVKTIQAVGVIEGSYKYEKQVPEGVRKDYVHKLPIHWLAKGINLDITAINGGKQLTLQTMYRLWSVTWPKLRDLLIQNSVVLHGLPSATVKDPEPYVLIIDEINRGNVSRIFGELITLLEPSKRAGMSEALEVVLPYSKERFSVPRNVYLLGTMNTADRSLAGLDVALRRRFVFHELMPNPGLLKGVTVSDGSISVPIDRLLQVMNQRIEALLDREHTLGHAYFLPLRQTSTLQMLAHIFREQVLPLLQEYFFDDWERIRWVLNDHRKTASEITFVEASGPSFETLFGPNVQVPQHRQSWTINAKAFDRLDSYTAILDTRVTPSATVTEQDNGESAFTQ